MATRPELHIAVAKTKSKASDYNDNFDMMMQFVDDSIGEAKDYVDGFMPSVTGQSGKFLTNNGTNANWASLGNQPFGNYIHNLIVTKTGDKKIYVYAGSCYDNTRLVVLKLNSAVEKTNSSQVANTTYYVYIIGSSDGSSTDIAISTNSTAPTYPDGYSLCRQIGKYATGANNKINAVYYYGINGMSDKGNESIKATAMDAVMPDYSRITSFSTSGGTIPYDCKLITYTGTDSLYDGSSGLILKVNNNIEYKARANDYEASQGSYVGYLPKNAVVSMTWGNASVAHAYIVPLKGVLS